MLENIVRVRWGWLIPPLVVVVLGCVFLAGSVWQSARARVKVWKSSGLAMVWHGLEAGVRDGLGKGGMVSEMEAIGEAVTVRLKEGARGEGVVLGLDK